MAQVAIHQVMMMVSKKRQLVESELIEEMTEKFNVYDNSRKNETGQANIDIDLQIGSIWTYKTNINITLYCTHCRLVV